LANAQDDRVDLVAFDQQEAKSSSGGFAIINGHAIPELPSHLFDAAFIVLYTISLPLFPQF
jgi:hypothetical protein